MNLLLCCVGLARGLGGLLRRRGLLGALLGLLRPLGGGGALLGLFFCMNRVISGPLSDLGRENF